MTLWSVQFIPALRRLGGDEPEMIQPECVRLTLSENGTDIDMSVEIDLDQINLALLHGTLSSAGYAWRDLVKAREAQP